MNPFTRYRGLSPELQLLVWLGVMAVVAVVLHLMHLNPALALAVAANPVGNPTLLDVIRQQGPDGSLLPIVESLTKLRPFLADATWIEANNGTFHRVNNRNSLPSPTYRWPNQGTLATKPREQQVDETTSLLSDRSQIDSSLIRMNGPEYRVRKIAGHLQGLMNQVEGDVFYSSVKTTPNQFHGLAPRFDAAAGTPAGNQVIKVDSAASGSDNMSMFLIGWGPQAVHMIYPRNTSGGIIHKDLGELMVDDGTGTGAQFPAFIDWFDWYPGLAVEDYRYVSRGCNISLHNLVYTNTEIVDASIDLLHQVQWMDKTVRWAYYAPRAVVKFLHHQAVNAVKTSTLRLDNIAGEGPIVMLNGIPLRMTDGMLITEGVVN